MDTNKKILENRKIRRKENLKLETKILKKISELKKSNVIKKKGKKIQVKYNKLHNQLTENEKKLMQRKISTLHKSIIRINQDDYNVYDTNDITLEILTTHAKKLYELDPAIRINFVTEPHKQGVDEILQRDLLNKKIVEFNLKAHAPIKGLYVYDGKIITKKKGRVKSLDTVVLSSDKSREDFDENKIPEGMCALGTCKVIIESGGAQTGASDDVIEFIEKANDYCKQNDNHINFFAQIDGEEGNKLTPRIKQYVRNDRVFVGSTDDLIEWLKLIKKNYE